MKSRLDLGIFLVLSLILTSACSTKKKEMKPQSSIATKIEGEKKIMTTTTVSEVPHYASISFDRGEAALSNTDRVALQELAHKVRESGREVDDIKIVTWADKDFTKETTPPSNADILLARKRAESIKKYLLEDLMEDEDIDYYNQAQRPGPLSRYFDVNDQIIRETFRQNRDENMTGDNHASKAIVIIDYENDGKML